MSGVLDVAAIIHEILAGYVLPLRGCHGVVHWVRVLENGLRLAEATGANPTIVSLFALLHDSQRINEGWDDGHGMRGAQYAATLRGRFFELNDAEFELLHDACAKHTDGLTDGDVTLQTCWDADRLDLGRVGITPSPRRLCTSPARKLLPWAHARAEAHAEPEFVTTHWKIEVQERRQ